MYHVTQRVRRVVAAVAVLPLMATLAYTSQVRIASPAVRDTVKPAAAATWGLPAAPVRLTIKTAGGAKVDSKDVYVKGSMTLQGVSYPLEIKGRGNTTWQWPKKPYKLKLSTAASLLGMPAERDWVLLANYADRSALRNYLALQFGRRTSLAWTPRSHFVDVVLNGDRVGTYLMTEQVEQSAQRVALPADGLLLEVDERYAANNDPGFRSGHGIPLAYNDPDSLTAEQQQQVKDAVAAFEAALYGPDFEDPTTGYRAYIDVSSFIDWYLVNELFKNVDSDFFSSVNVTWTPGGKFAMGPPWDFDLSSGYDSVVGNSVTDPLGWWARAGQNSTHRNHDTHWISRMMEDPSFVSQVRTRWDELRPIVDAMVSQIPASSDRLGTSVTADWKRWHAGSGQIKGSVHSSTYKGEVTFLQNWLRTRTRWISSRQVEWRKATVSVPERAGVVQLPVTIGGRTRMPTTVHYAVTGGTARGTDFSLPAGTLTYRNGYTTKMVPLTIKNDAKREGAETIKITLSSPSSGTTLGSPITTTVTIRAND